MHELPNPSTPAPADIAQTPDAPSFSRFLHAVLIEGGRFWERGRIAYNGIQVLLTIVMLVVRHSKAHYFPSNLLDYLGFAIVANLLYTAAYLPEAILQIPPLKPFTQFTSVVRWVILLAGIVFACFLAVIALDGAILVDPADD